MKTNKTIRSRMAMAVIFFAALASACKKDAVEPVNNGNPPVIPPVQQVSVKPQSITTFSETGLEVRKQTYTYNASDSLIRYVSREGNSVDSIDFFNLGLQILVKTSTTDRKEAVRFNPDKTLKDHIIVQQVTSTGLYKHIGNQLDSMVAVSSTGVTVPMMKFRYLGGQLNEFFTEVHRFNFNYYSNLPYQKGINEIPFVLKPIKYFKLMEQENRTSSFLFNKLLRQVIMNLGSGRFELHEYTYVFDAQNRVTQINESITNTTSTSSSQRVLKHIITY